MPYTYDVFFSYKRQKSTDVWYLGVKDKLEIWLEQELQRPVNIFYDSEDIRTGMRWRQKIATALLESRCMVCLWSPLYFRSKWCVAEWQTFEARGEQFDCELVVPARFHDGEHYPPQAKAVQRRDFSRFTSTSPRFWDSELALDFEQEELKGFAAEIAQIIRNAPAPDTNFPLIDEPEPSLIIPEPHIGQISHV